MKHVAPHVAIAILFRVFAIFRYRVDTDEPQHLHVAWNWTQGLLPYRDFFDNHMPLFHALFAPAIAASPESPAILTIGRVLMLPLTVATIVLVWFIAKEIYDTRVAFWAAIIASLFPPLALKGLEFRNDNLWTVLVLAAVALAVRDRSIAAGLLLGLAFLTSIKTAPFAIAFAIALRAPRRIAVVAMAAIAASAPPLIWLATQDAFPDLLRNAVLMNGLIKVAIWRRIAGVILFVAAFVAARRLRQRLPANRAFVAEVTLVGAGTVFAVSPLISPRDFLPHFALASIFAAQAATVHLGKGIRFVPAMLVIGTFLYGRMDRTPDPKPRERIATAIKLSKPTDFVLDVKGDAVFRRRTTYITFERVGREMVARGVVPETAPEDCIRYNCVLALGDLHQFPPRTRAFIETNFGGEGRRVTELRDAQGGSPVGARGGVRGDRVQRR